jgi:hypothetical protein
MTDLNEYPLGRLPSPDPRDTRYLMAAQPRAEPLATSIAYRRGPILNQGSTSSCVGHGWRAWLNGAPIRQTGGPQALAIYHGAQQVDEWEGEEPQIQGTSVRAGAKVLQQLGYIQSYIWAFSEPMMRQWILSGQGGVVIGVNWYEAMFHPDPVTGFLNIEGAWAGGHCVWVRGFNAPRQAYRIQNSWGEEWGQGGQAWLRVGDMQRLIAEDGEICCGTEIQVKPTEVVL